MPAAGSRPSALRVWALRTGGPVSRSAPGSPSPATVAKARAREASGCTHNHRSPSADAMCHSPVGAVCVAWVQGSGKWRVTVQLSGLASRSKPKWRICVSFHRRKSRSSRSGAQWSRISSLVTTRRPLPWRDAYIHSQSSLPLMSHSKTTPSSRQCSMTRSSSTVSVVEACFWRSVWFGIFAVGNDLGMYLRGMISKGCMPLSWACWRMSSSW
mmetsp:Transcript_26203/g.87788  ORF Transcript_26203/g.87788 Transcript_26203/m.87788 type:complete len:213 (-) Transcript_26203:237-875(-)